MWRHFLIFNVWYWSVNYKSIAQRPQSPSLMENSHLSTHTQRDTFPKEIWTAKDVGCFLALSKRLRTFLLSEALLQSPSSLYLLSTGNNVTPNPLNECACASQLPRSSGYCFINSEKCCGWPSSSCGTVEVGFLYWLAQNSCWKAELIMKNFIARSNNF